MTKKLAMLIAFFFVVNLASAQGTLQNVDVFIHNATYKVQGAIDRQLLFESTKADQALQFAIDYLSDQGGQVMLQRGRFLLENTIHLKNNITLSGSGPSTVLMMDENHRTGIAILGEEVDHAVVSNLSIKAPERKQNAHAGVVLDHSGGCVVENVFCYGLRDYGIWLRNNSFLCEIRSCKVADCGKSNIFLDELAIAGRGGDFVPNLVTNCIVYGGGAGIECNHALVVNIVACQAYLTTRPGFLLHNKSNSVLISGCRTFQIRDNAVEVSNSHEINISSNIFCWHEGHGIVLDSATWGTVSANNIIDTGHINLDPASGEAWTYWVPIPDTLQWERLKSGINLTGTTQGLTIQGNAVFNWGSNPPLQYGISESATCQNNTILGNNINYCQTVGVKADGNNTTVVNNTSDCEKPYEGYSSVESHRLHRFEVERIEKFIQANSH